MSTAAIQAMYAQRRKEIDEYIVLLENIETATQSGVPRIGDAGPVITTLQQRVLYSNVYLHLYNIVEAVITQCLDELATAATDVAAGNLAADLIPLVRDQWVRSKARTHVEMASDKRLAAAIALTNQLIDNEPIENFKVEVGGGGNWDNRSIENAAAEVGCSLSIDEPLLTSVRRHIVNDMGCLTLVKSLRNDLAHGSLSFGECGRGVSVSDLRLVSEPVLDYLQAVVSSFVFYLDNRQYLVSAGTP